MTPLNPQRFQRRQFLQTISGLAVGTFGAMLARADDLPKNPNPRAIFGDSVEPDWDPRVTITVGPEKAETRKVAFRWQSLNRNPRLNLIPNQL